MICGRRDGAAEMLLCDGQGCGRACHLACCQPPLLEVPKGEWFCYNCRVAVAETRCMECGKCEGEAEMLLCDGLDCQKACHMACCKPPLTEVPDGEWFCSHCQHTAAEVNCMAC